MSSAPSSSAFPVLIVDDEENIRFVLRQLLQREGYTVDEARDGLEAVEKVRRTRYAMVMMDIRMPKLDGISALKEMRDIHPDVVVVIITAHGTTKTAMEALQCGAYDYFTKPFDLNEVRVVVRRAVEKVRLLRQIEEMRRQSSVFSFDRIIGQSRAMQEVYNLVQRVLDNDVTVLITGESGTGKELVAAAVHHHSPRADQPLIKVNTVAIPEALLESELFGHERGAFTGAVQMKIGKVEAANGGTLFLDEIGDMSLPLQAKLLRVLQEREIERVGSTKTIKVDIRVICATNRDLAAMVEQGDFREDLYYRINVLPIHLPPLRRRHDDLPLLVDHFISVYNVRLKKNIQGVSQPALSRFLNYRWPGNVRELENTVQRTMLMARGNTIQLDDLPPTLRGETPAPDQSGRMMAPNLTQGHEALGELDLKKLLATDDFSTPLADRLAQVTDQFERYLIRAALEKTGGHRQETADLLHISRKSLHNKMVKFEMFDEE